MFKLKNINAGIIILKKKKNDYYTLIGSNIINSNKVYQLTGGLYIHDDKTALHTAIRQLIEQIFNIKINILILDDIVNNIKKKKLLLTEYIYIPNIIITYISSFKLLDYVYEYIYNKKFNLYNFFYDRNKKLKYITDNKLSKISLLNITELFKKHIKMKRITKYILFKLKIILNIKL